MPALFVEKLTGSQIQHLQTRFGLVIGDIDFTNNETWVRRPNSRFLDRKTVARMLGINEQSTCLQQDNNWVKVKF